MSASADTNNSSCTNNDSSHPHHKTHTTDTAPAPAYPQTQTNDYSSSSPVSFHLFKKRATHASCIPICIYFRIRAPNSSIRLLYQQRVRLTFRAPPPAHSPLPPSIFHKTPPKRKTPPKNPNRLSSRYTKRHIDEHKLLASPLQTSTSLPILIKNLLLRRHFAFPPFFNIDNKLLIADNRLSFFTEQRKCCAHRACAFVRYPNDNTALTPSCLTIKRKT